MSKDTLRRNRLKLICLAGLFFGPLAVAWLLVSSGWRPAGSVNHGELIQPPLRVAAEELSAFGALGPAPDFSGHWTLLLLAPGGCAADCVELLDQTGRAHVVLNQNMDRVRRVLILPPAASAPVGLERAGVDLLRAPATLFSQWQADALSVQLMDPRGFRMMSYPLPLDASGLVKDLQRLLRVSRRDVERFQVHEED